MDKYIIKDIRYMIYEYCLPKNEMDKVIISLNNEYEQYTYKYHKSIYQLFLQSFIKK